MQKTGVLLINLGTPSALKPAAIRTYLREFLSDPYVIDLPYMLRFFLVNGIILPFRIRKTFHAYQQIWKDSGSPLMRHSIELAQKLQKMLRDDYQVSMAMRYGKPSIRNALFELKCCEQIIVLPLFPQYAFATNQSVIEKTKKEAESLGLLAQLFFMEPFYKATWYIDALSATLAPYLEKKIDAVLFSYHGVPERQLKKAGADCSGCDRLQACPAINEANQYCYRAHCYATSTAVAEKLHLNPEEVMVSFQSRLGNIPWIQPYTDELLPKLYQQGVRRLLVICPSFVADCLETLEEIGIRARQQWLDLGGQDLLLVPCLNSEPIWVSCLAEGIKTKKASS